MAIATSVVNAGNGVLNRVIQAITTDAVTAADTTFSFGFKPRLVQVLNTTDRLGTDWYEGMAATQSITTAAAGTRALDTNSLIVVNADGTVTLKAAVMVASKSIVIIAEG